MSLGNLDWKIKRKKIQSESISGMEAKLDWENPETEEEEDIEEDWFQYDSYFLPDQRVLSSLRHKFSS